MKVKLINVADYEIKEGKTSDIPFSTFVNLCGECGVTGAAQLPRVRLFKSVDEFKNLTAEEMDTLKQDEDVKILPNGQFLVFLRGKDKEKEIKPTEDNATADTKKN